MHLQQVHQGVYLALDNTEVVEGTYRKPLLDVSGLGEGLHLVHGYLEPRAELLQYENEKRKRHSERNRYGNCGVREELLCRKSVADGSIA